ncbi:MAG: hypothetical protein M3Y82_10970 [Verrucomicrobiota bacterium]|nr:hypothetical protein [Verrucomicrobiota bacterium]
MMKEKNWLTKVFGIKTFSPAGFFSWAILLVLFFAFCHFADWREHTSFISGTSGSETISAKKSSLLGLIYLISYFGFVLAAPILVLGATIFAGFLKLQQISTR